MKKFIHQLLRFASSGLSAIIFLALVMVPSERLQKQGLPEDLVELSPLQRIEERYRQEFEMTYDGAINAIPRDRLIDAHRIMKQKQRYRSPIPGLSWEEVGPNNVGGRTRAILIDSRDPTNNTVFAAGVGGGLWKTNNFLSAVPLWQPVDDFFDNIAISSIVQDPTNPNILYFGTGEGWFNGDAIRGLGIWKSTTGGSTWTQLSSTNNATFHYVQKLLVDTNSNLYAATRDGGVQRSDDGGNTWTQVLGTTVGLGNTNRAADLELASNGDIFAALGIFSTGGIYRSSFAANGTGTGEAGTWTDVTPTGSGSFRRIEIATAPSNSSRVYALCQSSTTNDVSHIFRTNNSGQSWISETVPTIIDQGANSNFTRGQAWYDLIAAVDPNDEDVVYIGGVDALRSTDAGDTWEQITTWSLFAATGFGPAQNVHADHHAIVFLPGSSSSAIWGTDGGLHYSSDLNVFTGKPTFLSKNLGYNVTQFYACALHPDAGSYYMLAGSQDNGTQRFTAPSLNATVMATGGDGAFCHIDQDNPNIQITSYVYNNYYISSNGGASFSSFFFGNTGRFINPTDYDDEANILYAAHTAGKFARIQNVGSTNTFSTDTVPAFAGGVISAVTADPNTPNRIWFGVTRATTTGSPKIIRIDNAHTASFTALDRSVPSPSGVPVTAYISSIAVQDGNPDHLLVTFSNYGLNSVWETLNGGVTWSSVEGDLPDMPVRWAMFDPENPDAALLATELGVWTVNQLNGSNTDWEPTNSGLANVRVDMIQHRKSDNLIAAATHGRGLYINSRELILYESFSGGVPGSWTNLEVVGNGQSTSKWVHTTTGPSGTFPISPLRSATAYNGWMIFDSDLNCNDPEGQDAWLISPLLDASDKDQVLLSFLTYYRSFNDRPQIRIGTDLNNRDSWATIEVFPGIAVNQYGGEVAGGSGSTNPQVMTFDISAYAAGLSNFYIAFQFLSDATTNNGGNQTGCGYAWQIDDVWVSGGSGVCADELNLVQNPLPSGLYQAAGTITSGGVVQNGTQVDLRAGDLIRLTPGFHAQPGSIFSSLIQGCALPLLPPAYPSATQEISPVSYKTRPVGQPEDEQQEVSVTEASGTSVRVFPNPFREETTVEFELVEEQQVTLTVFDMKGLPVQTLLDQSVRSPGFHQLKVDRRRLAGGVYFLVFQYKGRKEVRKMVVME